MDSPVCLIFGGTRGLGASIARCFLMNQRRVLIVGRSRSAFDEFKSQFDSSLERAGFLSHLKVDLDDLGSPREIHNYLTQNYKIRTIIHNYGGTVKERIISSDLSEWNACLWKNVFFSAKMNALMTEDIRCGGHLKRIIHISSASARHLMGSQLYATSKALLNAYVKTNGRILARSGIVQLAVAPGAIATTKGPWESKPKAILEDFLSHYQFCGHLGSEDTIAALVFALDGPAGEFCHGNIIEADGASV